jgi:hypothetical protein
MEGINYWYFEFMMDFCDHNCWTTVKAPDYISKIDLMKKLRIAEDVSTIIELEPLDEPENHFAYNHIGFDFIQFITNGKYY